MNLGRLSYIITGETKPLQNSLKQAQSSVKSADSSMKKGASNISKNAKTMGQDASAGVSPMTDGLQAVHPAAGMAVSGMKKASLAARALQAAMGPIGIALAALSTAVAALTSYFRNSVEGQQQFAKIMAYVGGVADTVKDLFIDLGRWIVRAFTDPQQAVMDLWEVIKNNFINRFQGMVDMVVSGWTVIRKGAEGVGLAIAGIFDKSKREQAKQAFAEMGQGMADFGKASHQAITGVDDLIGKMGELGRQASDRASETMRLQERENQLWWDQLEAKVDIAEIEGELAEARRMANDDSETATTQVHAMNKAMELVNEKYTTQRRLLEEELAIQEERMALGHDEEADIEKRNDLQVQLINLRKQEEDMSRTLLRRQTTINNRLEAERKARNEIFEEIKKARMEEEERAVYGLQQALSEQLEAHNYTEAERAEITEYYEQQIADVRKQAAEEERQAREDLLSEIQQAGMTEVEIIRQTMDEKLAAHEWSESERAKITQYYQGQIDDIIQEGADKEKAQKDAVLERIRQNSLSQEDVMREQMQRELEMFSANEEQKAMVREYWENRIRESTQESADMMDETWSRLREVAGGAMAGVANEIGAMVTGAETSFKSLANSMLSSISQIINGLLAKAIAGMIAGEAQKGLLGLATAAVGVGALKAMFSSNVPQFADGGKVTSPTLAMFGEYPGARTNPEYALRQDQLMKMGGGGDLKASFKRDEMIVWIEEGNRRINNNF